MRIQRSIRHTALALALVSTVSGVGAATENAAARFLEQGGEPGTPWVSGGVGSDERQYMLGEYGSSYNLKLEFAVSDSSYLGGIDVVISKPAGGTVLTVHSRGPWLMTRLPPGDYRVRVTGYGRSVEQSLKVPARGLKSAVFKDWTEAEVSAALRAGSK